MSAKAIDRRIPFTSSRELYIDGVITHVEYALSLYCDGILTGGEALEFAVALEKERADAIANLNRTLREQTPDPR